MTLIHAMVANPCNNDPRKHAPKGKKVNWKTEQPSSSWDQIKNLLTCKQIEEDSKSHHIIPSKNPPPNYNIYSTTCNKICRSRKDAVDHVNTRTINQGDHNSPENNGGTAVGQETMLLSHKSSYGSGSSSSLSVRSSSSRGLQFRKLSGCYECHAVVDPTRYPLPINSSIRACTDCGEVFPEIESFEHHQAIMHAVSELGPEDSSRDIVEIIFKSSWLKRDNPLCQIERILKVHNTHRTIQRFEDYRDSVKARANINNAKRNARCAADGNELLRFHSATLACSLGARGSSSLCGSVPACGVCNIIRHGFQGNGKSGIRTTATSGRAHDCLGGGSCTRGAMLVCRVIAGKVKRVGEVNAAADEDGSAAHIAGSYDSLAGCAGLYSNIEELYVFNSRAILPCFVVIYKALESSGS